MLAALGLVIHWKRPNLTKFSFEINGDYVTDGQRRVLKCVILRWPTFLCRLCVAVRISAVLCCSELCVGSAFSVQAIAGKGNGSSAPVVMGPSHHTRLGALGDLGSGAVPESDDLCSVLLVAITGLYFIQSDR